MSTTSIRTIKDVPFLVFNEFVKIPWLIHGLSTRDGGISTGYRSSMNLGFGNGDDPDKVKANYKTIGEAIGFTPDEIILPHQIHSSKVISVTKEDRGYGVTRPFKYEADGCVTDNPRVILAVNYADCVPLFFVDPIHRAIGTAHSGWKGTVAKIGEKTIRKMQECFGSKPSELLAGIGPSICQDCYEVSEDVIEQIRQGSPPDVWPFLYRPGKQEGKYQLNLWETNRRILLEAGVEPGHILCANLCTCCHPRMLFSHRYTGGKRGTMAGFLGIA